MMMVVRVGDWAIATGGPVVRIDEMMDEVGVDHLLGNASKEHAV